LTIVVPAVTVEVMWAVRVEVTTLPDWVERITTPVPETVEVAPFLSVMVEVSEAGRVFVTVAPGTVTTLL
jgi:hypothetical protein